MRFRRGVSLIELLIAITIVGLIAGGMARMLSVNSRATGRDDAAREARAVSRSALNLLESELRPVEPAGVISPTNSLTLTIREPYAFGMICGITGGATLALLPSGEIPANLEVPGKAGWAWRDINGVYQYEVTTGMSPGAAGTCTGVSITPLTAQGGKVVAVSAPSGTPAIGSIAFLYRQITYTIAASTSAPGKLALFRTVVGRPAEEIAAPLASTARFRFHILDDPIVQDTTPTVLADLRGIQFVLPGESRRIVQTTGLVATTPFTTSIFFQNRPN